jgi:hypothetical protein
MQHRAFEIGAGDVRRFTVAHPCTNSPVTCIDGGRVVAAPLPSAPMRSSTTMGPERPSMYSLYWIAFTRGQVVNAIDGIANVMERCRRAKCSSLSECLTPHFAIRDPRTLRSLRSAEPPAMPAARGFIPDDRRTSAHVSDAPLGCFLGLRFWLCRKLKHRCLLTLA